MSGIADELLSVGVIYEGSVDQALRGKQYQRGVRYIMLIREKTENFLQISCSSSKESQDKLRSTHNCLEEDEGLNEIVYLVFEPTGTNMEGYWILFLVMTDLLIQNISTCHFRNLYEYLSLIY